MSVTASNGTVISATEIQWPCKKYGAMYLYCTYTKGTESDLTISFTVTDDSEPTSGAFSLYKILNETGAASLYTVTLAATATVAIPVTLPKSASKVNVTFTFNTPGLTPGDITVFGNMDDGYR